VFTWLLVDVLLVCQVLGGVKKRKRKKKAENELVTAKSQQ